VGEAARPRSCEGRHGGGCLTSIRCGAEGPSGPGSGQGRRGGGLRGLDPVNDGADGASRPRSDHRRRGRGCSSSIWRTAVLLPEHCLRAKRRRPPAFDRAKGSMEEGRLAMGSSSLSHSAAVTCVDV
jgi:hypothetical protein